MNHGSSIPVHPASITPKAQDAGRDFPVHFVGGAACGMYGVLADVQHIDLPSPTRPGRLHLYRFSGRVLPTEPPCRVFTHVGIVDRT